MMQYNLADTHILEEPATFLFQVREISSARLQSTTSQKKKSYHRKNPNRSTHKIRFIYMNQSVPFSGNHATDQLRTISLSNRYPKLKYHLFCATEKKFKPVLA